MIQITRIEQVNPGTPQEKQKQGSWHEICKTWPNSQVLFCSSHDMVRNWFTISQTRIRIQNIARGTHMHAMQVKPSQSLDASTYTVPKSLSRQ